MDNKINVPVLLKVLGEADLSGAGCGSSASPVLRRGQLSSTQPGPVISILTERLVIILLTQN